MPRQDKKQLITNKRLMTDEASPSTSDTYSAYYLTLLQRKKEKRNAWMLTLFIHLVIGGLLIGYWYSHNQPKPLASSNNPSAAAAATTTTRLTTIASTSTLPATIASSTTASAASSTIPSTLSTNVDSLSLPPVTFNAPTMYFFAPDTEAGRDIQTMMVIDTSAPSQPLPRAPVPATKNPVQSNAEHPLLTKRDVPQMDAPNPNSSQSSNTHQLAKQAKDISETIDDNNTELSRLIDEVKTNNQRKIDADIMNNAEKTSKNPSPSP